MIDFPELKTIGERLKWARERLQLTQRDLAKMANVSAASINKIETGKTLNPRNTAKLAEAVNIPHAWLLVGNDSANLSKEAVDIAVAWSSLSEDMKEVIRKTINATKPSS